MIVVTGGTGMIGREVVSQLCADGIRVKSIPKNIFDLSGGENLEKFVDERPDAIIHLAAVVPPRYPDSAAAAERSRLIDRCVYSAADHWGCRVVYASTCALYDKRIRAIKTEEMPIIRSLESPYLQAKYDGEEIFRQLKSYALMRLPAPIGAGLPNTVVAKKFYDLARAGGTITLWGTGRREQNYVDSADLAKALIKAAMREVNGVYNIAQDLPTTMYELAKVIIHTVGHGDISFTGTPDPLDYQLARYSNMRAGFDLAWNPVISLEESIRSMGDL